MTHKAAEEEEKAIMGVNTQAAAAVSGSDSFVFTSIYDICYFFVYDLWYTHWRRLQRHLVVRLRCEHSTVSARRHERYSLSLAVCSITHFG